MEFTLNTQSIYELGHHNSAYLAKHGVKNARLVIETDQEILRKVNEDISYKITDDADDNIKNYEGQDIIVTFDNNFSIVLTKKKGDR